MLDYQAERSNDTSYYKGVILLFFGALGILILLVSLFGQHLKCHVNHKQQEMRLRHLGYYIPDLF